MCAACIGEGEREGGGARERKKERERERERANLLPPTPQESETCRSERSFFFTVLPSKTLPRRSGNTTRPHPLITHTITHPRGVPTYNDTGLGNKSGKILFLGLDNAGKTTLLQRLTENRVTSQPPTLHPNSEILEVGRIRFRTFDLGGHEAARKLWKDYFPEVNGIIYIVDSNDRSRFPEAKKELDELLSDDKLAGVPFVVLGNKIDISTSAGEAELRSSLGLLHTSGKDTKVVTDGVHPVELFMCSVVKKTGYADGFKWLSNFI